MSWSSHQGQSVELRAILGKEHRTEELNVLVVPSKQSTIERGVVVATGFCLVLTADGVGDRGGVCSGCWRLAGRLMAVRGTISGEEKEVAKREEVTDRTPGQPSLSVARTTGRKCFAASSSGDQLSADRRSSSVQGSESLTRLA